MTTGQDMANGKVVKRLVNLEPQDIQAVLEYAQQLGLSEEKGFSPALRIIIREWEQMKQRPESCQREEGQG